ncbi:MAG: hypothetical protein VR68_11735 [Peptococcaceae bacterium BRH_c4a]|nr:MAG: hypothetical protein VR68_11735 [Peptococcaceae bacterium BRH_c4a]
MSTPIQFQITNPARTLATPFKTVNQAVPSKSSIPILEGILFQLTPDGLTLVGCDMELWIIVRVGEVKLPIGTLLPSGSPSVSFVLPKKVADAILRLPDGQTLFEFHPERLNLKINYGNGFKNSQTHQLYSAKDYIQVPEVQGEEFQFSTDLKRVAFAVNSGNIAGVSPAFTGVFINFPDRKVAASDTIRFAAMDLTGEAGGSFPEGMPSIVLPVRAANLISGMDEPALTIAIDADEGRAKLIQSREASKESNSDSGSYTMISRLLPHRYPDLKPLLSQLENPPLRVEFSAAEMVGALNRVALMLPDKTMPKFTFTPEGFIKITAQSESGQFKEDVSCQIVGGEIPAGETREALFNVRQVTDALKHAGGDRVVWGLTGQYGPSVIRAADGGGSWDGGGSNNSGDGWLCVIVPGRLVEKKEEEGQEKGSGKGKKS